MMNRSFAILAMTFGLAGGGLEQVGGAATAETSTGTIAPAVANGRVATLDPSDLQDFEAQPPAVRGLIREGLRLTQLGLGYRYGSDNPATGGMDCSGTVFYLLRNAGVADAPRDSAEMYRWVWTRGRFHAVVSSNPATFELARLQPGDLLFWSGTYRIDRDPPITHVMIYLGINRATGRRVMVGASEGRRFNDVSRYGVSVFDFVLPQSTLTVGQSGEAQARFVGYGSFPGLREAKPAAP